jgi:hypothetical protein
LAPLSPATFVAADRTVDADRTVAADRTVDTDRTVDADDCGTPAVPASPTPRAATAHAIKIRLTGR